MNEIGVATAKIARSPVYSAVQSKNGPKFWARKTGCVWALGFVSVWAYARDRSQVQGRWRHQWGWMVKVGLPFLRLHERLCHRSSWLVVSIFHTSRSRSLRLVAFEMLIHRFMMYKCLRSRGWFQLFWMTLVTVGVANLESSSQLHVLAAIAGMSAERWAFPGSCSELAKQVELSATHDQSQTGTGDEFLKRGFQCFFYCQHFLPTFASLRYFFFCCCLRWQHPQRLEYSTFQL